uniref:Uncharacterized protein n=1 Tax=Nymphaea colorata TaxID=210225 RepID=A0A5K1EEF0_9MAGN
MLVIDGGIWPVSSLSAKLRTVRWVSLPRSQGIWPDSRFPTRSSTRRKDSEVMQRGISPVTFFQSAMMRLDSRSRRQIDGERRPVMNPGRPARRMIGSSDSPRRLMSATRPLNGSQLTPCHPWQQLSPVHVLKTPRYGSESPALNSSSAALSDGGQKGTAAAGERSTARSSKTNRKGRRDMAFCCGRHAALWICVAVHGGSDCERLYRAIQLSDSERNGREGTRFSFSDGQNYPPQILDLLLTLSAH